MITDRVHKGGEYMSNIIPSYFLMIDEKALNELRKKVSKDDPVSAKLMVDNITYNIKISYRGDYTRKFRKRSYMIDFDDTEKFLGVSRIHLNAEYKDPSLIRNKLSLDFFQDLGVLSPDSQHINFYRNDSIKGVYLHLESVDNLFLEKRDLPAGPIYYAINNDANFSLMRDEKPKKSLLSGYKRVCGDSSDDTFLHDLITTINTTIPSYFPDEISQKINIDQYFRWLAGAVCTMNNDGFTHNYALYRNSDTCLFEILPWDYDATWGRKVNGGIMNHTYVPIEGKSGNHLNYVLLQVPEFRKLYKETLEEILETMFTVDYIENKVLPLHQCIRPQILLDPYKKNKIDIFDNEPELIFQFIRERNDYLKNQLSNLD